MEHEGIPHSRKQTRAEGYSKKPLDGMGEEKPVVVFNTLCQAWKKRYECEEKGDVASSE